MQLNLKHETIHNENKTDVHCDTAYQCIIHAFGSIDLWNYRFTACSFGRDAKGQDSDAGRKLYE